MAHVVKQSGCTCSNSILGIDCVSFTQSIEHARHEMKCAERMSEARMLRALVRVETKTELFDAAQALKLGSINQSHHQLAFVGISLQTDDIVNWIAIDAFRH